MLWVNCTDCRGTGGDPDCRICTGYRCVRLPALYARGYRKADLEEVDESDGFAECPGCRGMICPFCMGEGQTWPEMEEQQERRVLQCAKWGEVPPVIVVDHFRDGRSRIRREDMPLSHNAAARLRERGLINWYCSILGDEISLTANGERAYDALYSCA